jgi:rod shape-determining protein MreB
MRHPFHSTGRDVAIDLGTANTLVFVRGEGIVLSEPSVVAVDTQTGEVHAVGREAQRMIGRTPASISAVRPLRHGVIADFEVTEQMLRHFLRAASSRGSRHPRVVVCAPSGITKVEQRAVEEACLAAGAREVALIEEPMAAAIGAGLPVAEAQASTVLDIGGGTSEVAVISLGGIVVARSLPVGGYELDDAITAHLRDEHRLAIGSGAAETLKIELGSAMPITVDATTEIRGRSLTSGMPTSLQLSREEIREVLAEPVQRIIDAVTDTLEETPPELAADVSRHGILLAGGGSLLDGMPERLAQDTGMETYLADDPLACVALGAGEALEEFDRLRQRVPSRLRSRFAPRR